MVGLISAVYTISCGQLTGENTGAYDDNKNQPSLDLDGKPKTEGLDKAAEKEETPPSSQDPSLIGGLEFLKLGVESFLLSGSMDNSGNSAHLFNISTYVDESQVTLHFFSNKNLKKGLSVALTRSSNDTVKIQLNLNGLSDSFNVESSLGSLLELTFDVHNDHSDMHILVWNKNGPFEDYDECSFDGGCLYNSEDFALDVWLGVGKASGKYWGIETKKKDTVFKLEGPLDAKSSK